MQKRIMGMMSLSKLSCILILFVTVNSMEQKLPLRKEITQRQAAKILCLLYKRGFNPNRPVRCTHPGCYADFPGEKGLKSHIKVVHNSRKNFACTEPNCTARFRCPYYLRRHNAVKHSDERPFVCSECNLSFKLEQYLVTHLARVHKITRP